jgi:hypothetical protein
MDSRLEQEIKKDISKIREYYESEIKPLIEEKHYNLAEVKVANVNFVLLKPRIAELAEYSHSGLTFVAVSMGLEEKLREGEGIEEAMKMFEAYLAQIELSQKTRELFPK